MQINITNAMIQILEAMYTVFFKKEGPFWISYSLSILSKISFKFSVCLFLSSIMHPRSIYNDNL